jgi:hypothetical protein
MNHAAIKQLEKNSDIPVYEKINILMVSSDKKPAGHVIIASDEWQSGEPARSISKSARAKIKKLLDDFELSFESRGGVLDIGYGTHAEIIDIFIARNQETLDKLLDAHAKQDDRSLGKLYGYPPTATAAFVKGERYLLKGRPQSTDQVTAQEMMFLQHRLSWDNWQTEVQYLPAFAAHVKQLSPKIYDEYLNSVPGGNTLPLS